MQVEATPPVHEFTLQAFAIVDRNDKLLLFRNLGPKVKSDLDVQLMLEGSLDVFEEQMDAQIKTHGLPFNGNVGLVQRLEGFLIFGRELANNVRLLLMVQAMFGRQPSEAQLERVFRKLVQTCCNELSNPFYVPGSPFLHPSLHQLPEADCLQ
jgi:hypothetical protein